MLDDKTPHVAVVVQAVIPGPPLSPQIWGDKGGRRGTRGEGEPTVVATTLSDENGKYQFINLKPGRYQIRCYTLNGSVYYEEAENTAVETRRGASLQLEHGKSAEKY